MAGRKKNLYRHLREIADLIWVESGREDALLNPRLGQSTKFMRSFEAMIAKRVALPAEEKSGRVIGSVVP
jgi:hypothetical protein